MEGLNQKFLMHKNLKESLIKGKNLERQSGRHLTVQTMHLAGGSSLDPDDQLITSLNWQIQV
jgi:hypothetical protein